MERAFARRAGIKKNFIKRAGCIALTGMFRDLGDEIYAHLLFSYALLKAEDESEGERFLEFSKAVLSGYIGKVRPRLGRRPISGEDLKKELGLTPSPMFRQVLDAVEIKWLKGEINNRQQALLAAKKLVSAASRRP